MEENSITNMLTLLASVVEVLDLIRDELESQNTILDDLVKSIDEKKIIKGR